MTALTATLGPVRKTVKRIDATPSVTNTYSTLLNTVRDHGLLRRTPWFYITVFGILVAALGGATTGFVLLGDSWFQLLIAAALGVIFTQFAFLAHEASHRQVFASGPANDRAGRMLATAVVGISYAWWMTKHTRHHANPNTIGKDPDIAIDTVSFIEEDAAKQRGIVRAITKRQGYLFFPLLLLEGINLHALSFRTLVGKDKVDGRAREIVFIALRFAIYLGAIFTFLPLGMAFAFIGVQLAVFGVYMGASFAPNHKGMPIIEAGVKVDFLSKQVLTSRNIRGSWDVDLHGRPQLPDRAPPVPEHAPAAPAQGRGDRQGALRQREHPLHRDDAAEVVRHRGALPQPRRPVRPRPVRLSGRRRIPPPLTRLPTSPHRRAHSVRRSICSERMPASVVP